MLLNINMHREDNSKYLLYIEPKAVDKLQEPINDELTEMMEKALTKSKKGAASYSQLEDKGDGTMVKLEEFHLLEKELHPIQDAFLYFF